MAEQRHKTRHTQTSRSATQTRKTPVAGPPNPAPATYPEGPEPPNPPIPKTTSLTLQP